jgi:hypothetical protein
MRKAEDYVSEGKQADGLQVTNHSNLSCLKRRI